jgi:hypothetical protein
VQLAANLMQAGLLNDRLSAWLLASSCLLGACTGLISDPGENDGKTIGGPGTGPGGTVASGKQEIGVSSSLRRMTRDEYNNTVRDLLGDATQPANPFPPDEKKLGVSVGGLVSSLLAEQMQAAAEGIAERALTKLDSILPCTPAAIGEDACAEKFIQDFATRAFRRPVTAEESGRLSTLYASAKDSWGFSAGIGLVIRAVLQSPHFLYVLELDGDAKPGAKLLLTPWELASRLSYFFWSSTPDAELMALARSGELTQPEVIEAQARRMLNDDKAKDSVRAFHVHWLELEGIDTISKDSEYYPEFDEQLRHSMREETERFVEHAVLEDGRLGTLLGASYSFVDAKLAALYGAPAPTSAWQKTALPAGQRAGILTQASFLATQAKPNASSPVYRGKFVREALLCMTLPPPPNDLVIVPPNPDPNATTKQQFAQHSADPACSVCHRLMDPIGFGFESYDGIGAFRSHQNGLAVDSSGELLDTEDVDGKFQGAVELAARLLESEQVRDCVARHWFRFAVKRGEIDDLDSIGAAKHAFGKSGHDIRELMVAIALTDGFRYRKSEEASP